ncbi:hypothetical protein PAXINDRAFT_86979 [Paxillus involutus ATCC 200175]|uniref:WD40 repeat-like protein n=1 Tax=Paxillus involutus ATCC 200175 TaxID=664439 RepID=A0A0C9TG13_PAXIN|nr:hypothetical protein PAXINDRAFT_86979 [Paxillus involutus ATCC 200175]
MSNTSTKSADLTPRPLRTISAHDDWHIGIAYLPGEKRLVTCSHLHGTVKIWNAENGEQEGMEMEHGGGVEGFAVTKDGKRMLSGDKHKLLRVWDLETHQPIAEWDGHEANISCIATSPDDQLVASGDHAGMILIREMNLKEDGRIKHAIETGLHHVHSICFSPDGTKLASGHFDNTIQVFDVETCDELILGQIEGHTHWVYSVVWSLDGSRLFTVIHAITLSPDGTKLASASSDRTVRFWGTDSGDPIGEPLQHEGGVQAITFSPSGEFVACADLDGKVSIWRVPWWNDSKKVIAYVQLSGRAVSHAHCHSRHINRC